MSNKEITWLKILTMETSFIRSVKQYNETKLNYKDWVGLKWRVLAIEKEKQSLSTLIIISLKLI